jgi:hypothetical protein
MHGSEVAPSAQVMERGSERASEEEAARWAGRWWADYTQKHAVHTDHATAAIDAGLFTDTARLYALLEGEAPPVRLLRGSWLLERASALRRAQTAEDRRDLVLRRRQVLERVSPRAFLSAAEVRALPLGHSGTPFETCLPIAPDERHVRIVSISHGWLTAEHPDPHGQALVALAEQIGHERACCPGEASGCSACASAVLCGGLMHGCVCGVSMGGQACCRTHTQFPPGEFAVFYDFCSLPQKDEEGQRTPSEAANFAAALATMGVWYAHRHLTTYAMHELAPGWDGVVPISERGWPTFERHVSGLVKHASSYSWRRVVDPTEPRGSLRTGYRAPPEHPRDFAARLMRKTFTNDADCEVVATLYASTLLGSFGQVRPEARTVHAYSTRLAWACSDRCSARAARRRCSPSARASGAPRTSSSS